MSKRSLLFLIFILLAIAFGPASAQDQLQPDGPVYIVQEGDNLWDIALRFGVSVDAILAANALGADQPINVGVRLVIPGFENLGITGVLNTVTVGYGEDLSSLSRRTGVTIEVLARLNRLVSANEIYAGMPLVLVENEAALTEAASSSLAPGARPLLRPGQSLLELAVLRGENPWKLANANSVASNSALLPGQVLWLPQPGGASGPGGFPDAVSAVTVEPLPVGQGRTLQLVLSGEPGMDLGGSLAGYSFDFFNSSESNYDALQGVHAMLEPGFYPLVITGTLSTGESFGFSQTVYIKEGDYVYDPTLIVSPETIDPAVTKPEDAQWAALTAPVTPEKFWNGQFQAPVMSMPALAM